MRSLKIALEPGTRSAAEGPLAGAAVLFTWFCFLTPATAQVSPGSDGWQRVQSLREHTAVHVKSDSGAATCRLDRVDEAGLSCSSRNLRREFSRSQIREIKLSRRGLSAAKGAATGFGVGASAGLFGLAVLNGSDNGTMAHTSTSKALGVGAAIGGTGGILVGTIVGYSRGFSAGTVVYKRP